MGLARCIFRSVIRKPQAYIGLFLNALLAVAITSACMILFYHPDFKSVFGNIWTIIYSIFFLAILLSITFAALLYAVGTLCKEREPQFGLFMLLGMTRTQLRKLVCVETLLIGLVSIGMGIVTGIGISLLFLQAIRQMTDTVFPFHLPLEVISLVALAFFVLFVFISLFVPRFLRRKHIIHLLQGARRPKEEPLVSPWFTAAGLLSLGTIIAICTLLPVDIDLAAVVTRGPPPYWMICIMLAVAGAYFFFTQSIVWIIGRLRRNRSFAWCGIRPLWLGELVHRLWDNSRLFYKMAVTMMFTLTFMGVIIIGNHLATTAYIEGPPFTELSQGSRAQEMRAKWERFLQKKGIRFVKTEFEALQYVEPEEKGDGSLPPLLPPSHIIMTREAIRKIISLPSRPSVSPLLLQQVPLHTTILFCVDTHMCSAKRGETPPLLGMPILQKVSLPRYVYAPGQHFFLVNENTFAQLKQKARTLQGKEKPFLSPRGDLLTLEHHTAYWHPPLDQLSSTEVTEALRIIDPPHSGGIQDLSLSVRFDYSVLNRSFERWFFSLFFLAMMATAVLFSLVGSNFLISRMYTDIHSQQDQYRKLMHLGLTRAEMRRSVTVQIALFFFLPLVFSTGLASLFIVYFGRFIRTFLLQTPIDPMVRGAPAVMSWPEMLSSVSPYFGLFLLVEVCIFLITRYWITRSLQRVIRFTK